MQKPDEGKAKAVADLERRLAMLGNVDEPLPPPAFAELLPHSMPPPPPAYNDMSAPMAPPPPAYQFSAPPPPAYQFSAPSMPPPAVEAPPAATIAKPASAATTGSSRSGKDALMARIQAAKEKAQKEKEAKATPPPPALPAYHAAPPSMPMPMAPPAYDAMPPSYDAMPPPPPSSSSPPAFDSMAFPPPPPIDAVAPPPLPSYMVPPAASAPSFESLHTIQDDEPQQQHSHYANLHAMPPPAAAPAMDADILAALDPAEREQILEEQRQMLAQFEKSTSKKPLSASDPEDFDVAKAMAQFDQVDAQMQEDMKVAEELQKKEYGTAINAKSVAEKKKKASEAQSWYSWMTGKDENNTESSSKSKSSRSSSSEYPANTTSTSATTTTSTSTSTSTSSSASRGPRLVAAQTGDETPSVSRDDDEPDSKKGGLFASAFGTPEEEATLVAVPQFSRQRN